MKRVIILCVAWFFLLHFSVQAQNSSATSFPDPEFLNNVYLLRGDSLVPLEIVNAEMKSKTKALGYGGSEGGYYIAGEGSSMRIHQNEVQQFVVKLAGGMMMGDPSQMIHLYRLEAKKGERAAIMSKSGGMFNRGKSGGGESEVQFNVQKKKNDVYLLIPATALKPGEYAFLNSMQMKGNGMHPLFTANAFEITQ
jgi:hypothetical protein